MPHFEPSRKRRRHDDDEEQLLYSYYTPKQQQPDTLMTQQRDAWPRKVLPLTTKRTKLETPRLLEEEAYKYRLQNNYNEDTAPAPTRNRSQYIRTPCHVCGDHPAKASQLDAFAHCLGCGEWTCYICIRECQGWNGEEGSVILEQEALSRSFHMDDDDGDVSPKSQPKGGRNRGLWKAYGHQSIICRKCCVEPRETDGELACFGCYQRFPAHHH